MKEVQRGQELARGLLLGTATQTIEIIVAMRIHTQAIIWEGTAVEIEEVLGVVIVEAEIEDVDLILQEDMEIIADRGVEAGIGTKARDILTPLIEGDEFCNLIS